MVLAWEFVCLGGKSVHCMHDVRVSNDRQAVLHPGPNERRRPPLPLVTTWHVLREWDSLLRLWSHSWSRAYAHARHCLPRPQGNLYTLAQKYQGHYFHCWCVYNVRNQFVWFLLTKNHKFYLFIYLFSSASSAEKHKDRLAFVRCEKSNIEAVLFWATMYIIILYYFSALHVKWLVVKHGYRSPFWHELFRQAPFQHSPFRHAPVSLTLTLPVPHVDLGAGLLQYADNRPTIITLVGMVGVGMVPAPR